MANLSKPLNQGFAAPSIVANYGPYASVAAAHAALVDDGLNIIGYTVGIQPTGSNTITEYWYQGGTGENNLVAKGGGNKDKAYNPSDYSGMGKVYLKRNMDYPAYPFDGRPKGTIMSIESDQLEEAPEKIVWDIDSYRFFGEVTVEGVKKYYDSWPNCEPYTEPKTDSWFYTESGSIRTYYKYSDAALVEDTPTDKVNLLTQSMMTATNTIYVIQDDFDLNGETITVPADCVLEFDGGSFKNGNIILDDTNIIANNLCIFKNIALSGSYTNESFKVAWLGCLPDDDSIDCTPIMKKALGLSKRRFLFGEGAYYFSEWLIVEEGVSIIGVIGSGINFKTIFYPFTNSQYYIIKLGGSEGVYDITGARCRNISIENVCFCTKAGFVYKSMEATVGTNTLSTDNPYICGALVLNRVEIGRFSISGSGIHNMPLLLFGYSYECTFDNIIMYGNHGKSDLPIISVLNDANHAESACTIKRLWVEVFVGPILWMHPTATFAEINVDEIMIEGTINWEGESINTQYPTSSYNFPSYYDTVNIIPIFKLAYYRGSINSIYINAIDFEWNNSLDDGSEYTSWDTSKRVTRALFDLSKYNYGGLNVGSIFNTGNSKNILLCGTRSVFNNNFLSISNALNITIWNKSNVPVLNGLLLLTSNPINLIEDKKYYESSLIDIKSGSSVGFYQDVDSNKPCLRTSGETNLISSTGLVVNTKYLILGIKPYANLTFDVQYWKNDEIVHTETNDVSPDGETAIMLNSFYTYDYIKLVGKPNRGYYVYSVLATNNIPSIFRAGTTDNRPGALLSYNDQGFNYFDTTLKKTVYYSSRKVLKADAYAQNNGYVFIDNVFEKGETYEIFTSVSVYYTTTVIICKDNNIDHISDPDNIVLISKVGKLSEIIPIFQDQTTYKYIYVKTNIPQGTLDLHIAWLEGIWVEEDGAIAGALRNGNSALRPIANDIYVGFMYFDTQINKPIYAKELSDTGAVIWVDAAGAAESYSVETELTNITFNGLLSAAAGQSYVATLTADDGYVLPSSITVEIGDTTLTESTGYTYDQSTGAIEVLGTDGISGVTDVLTITATAASA